VLINGSLCIIGLDPGGTTGWATYNANVMRHVVDPDQAVGTWEFFDERWNSGEIGPGPHYITLWDLLGLKRAQNFIIVCESFEYRHNQRDNVVLVSLEYIGVAKLFAEMEPQTPTTPINLVLQTAATGKSFWYPKIRGTERRDASKLKAVGLYSPGHVHANDATAHLLHFMENTLGRKDLLEPLKNLD
jgi:hypothetical protein